MRDETCQFAHDFIAAIASGKINGSFVPHGSH